MELLELVLMSSGRVGACGGACGGNGGGECFGRCCAGGC
jgi:hypothetical protein